MNINSFFQKFKINKPFLGIIILFTAICALNITILITLWRHGFDDGTYSHAFLIPFISLYLYYELAQSGKLQFRESLSVIPTTLLILSCYLLFVTSNAQISIGYWGALLAVLITSVTMLYRFNWYIIFPTAFLVFIFPFWGTLVPLLQSLSVVAVTYMMSFTGVPTFVEAEVITIPAGVFEIAGGCSGLRYMIVSLAIGSLFIFLNIRDPKRAMLFLSATILGALLTNWIRITALILIGEYTNMESSLMSDHNTFGWYLYVPFMVLLFVWGNKLADQNLLEGNHQKSHTKGNNSINVKIATLHLITILLSSTTLFWLTSGKGLQPTQRQRIAPEIYNFSDLAVTNKDSITTFHYLFDSTDLDSKPTYYENSLIPLNWKVISSSINSERFQTIITNGQKKSKIKAYYKLDDYTTGDSRKFKTHRIKQSFWGKQKTELIWSIKTCDTHCEETHSQ